MASVKVPQDDGDITLTTYDPVGMAQHTFSVSNGTADVPDDLVGAFLERVPGSEVAASTPPSKASTSSSGGSGSNA